MLLPSQHRELLETYNKIYTGEVDDVTDVMIEEIVEELVEECLQFGYTLDEATDAIAEAAELYFDTEELEEAKVTYGRDTESPEQRTARAKERLGGMKATARKAAVKSAVSKVKSKAVGAAAGAVVGAHTAAASAKQKAGAAASAAKRTGAAAKAGAQRAGAAVSAAAKEKKAQVKSGVKKMLGRGLRAIAGGAGAVAQKARKAGAAAGRAAERLGESVDVFDCILEHLVAEGYADTNEGALVIMANMSEEWRESILEEVLDEKLRERPKGLPYGPVGKGFRELTVPQRKKMLDRGKEHTKAAMGSGEEYSGSHAKSSAIDSALRSRRLGGRG